MLWVKRGDVEAMQKARNRASYLVKYETKQHDGSGQRNYGCSRGVGRLLDGSACQHNVTGLEGKKLTHISDQRNDFMDHVRSRTKLVYSEYLSAQTGARIYLKPENMQHAD